MILHPQLQQDCIIFGRFELCALLLLSDQQYPWFILVPQRENIKEIHQLRKEEQQQLIEESSLLSEVLMATFHADKMNIAALGNMVPQLHIHHIARFTHDIAWPKPVWGMFPPKPYTPQEIETLKEKVLPQLKSLHPA